MASLSPWCLLTAQGGGDAAMVRLGSMEDAALVSAASTGTTTNYQPHLNATLVKPYTTLDHSTVLQRSKGKNTRGYATVLTSAVVCVCVSLLCVSTVTLFGRSVAVTAAAASGGGAPMAAAAEATAEEVPNVELVVETATSCDRSRLCMRLPDRHLAYKGGCTLSAGQAQAGAIHYTHVAYSTR